MFDGFIIIEMSARTPDTVFKAIADPTRREILRLLKAGPRNAGDLAGEFDVTNGAMSHHFNVLKAAGLIRSERDGQQIIYSLNITVFEDAAMMLTELFNVKKPRK